MTQPFHAMPAFGGPSFRATGWELLTKQINAWDATARVAREVGPICRIPIPGMAIAVLNDPEAIGDVLIHRESEFFKGAPGPALRPMATDASMFIQPGGERWKKAHDANPMAHAVSENWLESIVPDMEAVVTEKLDRWVAETPHLPLGDTFDSLRHLGFDIFSRNLFGENLSNEAYRRFIYIANCLDFRVKWPLPIMPPVPFWRRIAMNTWSSELSARVERRRRENDDGGSDLLSKTIRANVQTSAPWLVSQLTNLYYGGVFSSTTAVAATLYELGRHPEALARVQVAVDKLLKKGPLTYGALMGCAPLQSAILEAMRIKPPVAVFVRQVNRNKPAMLGEYLAPAGATLLISCKHLHICADHWDAPLHFRPERWENGGTERDPLGSGHYFPFGRGPRTCYAQDYAMVYISLVVALLLGRSRPEIGRDQQWREGFWFGVMYPKKLRSRFLPR